jgi:hypothetical protein
MLPNHTYLSLVVPPQDRILLAIALLCIAAVLAYFLVKALLFSAERESGLLIRSNGRSPGKEGAERGQSTPR